MAALSGFDHIHVYVPDREQAAQWFQAVLGFKVVEALRVWAADGGPLTIGDESEKIHLALFERSEFIPSTAIAFAADAKNFMEWKPLLEKRGILARCTDHDLAWSLYFHDPYDNMYEITTYDHPEVSEALNG
jgi:catechol 2,3-dioxygenase-like lactoylglutathione lyase family enzyme